MLTPIQRNWLTLAMVPGVGSALFLRLLARYRDPAVVLRQSIPALSEVVGEKVAGEICRAREHVDIDGQERLMDACGARLITMECSDYPSSLAEIYDPPLALFVRGTLLETDQYAVAIVGTRRPSPYGIEQAERLAEDLARRGITVVSGMAEGIDGAAHRGALRAGGRTIAVLGCGVDEIFPLIHARLMEEIIGHGAVISPFPMGMKALKGNFPRRNRLISGLSMGVVVVEAPPGSGSLITARFAAEQGKEVFAVPGPVNRVNSRGPHALIREGAKLVESADDILQELKLPVQFYPKRSGTATQADLFSNANTDQPPESPAFSDPPGPGSELTPIEADVLASLNPEGSFVDEVALVCRISVSEALAALTMLELKGLARQFSGQRFAPAASGRTGNRR